MQIKIQLSRFRTVRVGFRFDMYAYMKMCELYGIELDASSNLPQDKMVYGIFYGAYISYCKENGKRAKYADRFNVLFDNLSRKQFDDLVNEFLNSKMFGTKTMAEYAEEGSKKK